MLGLTTFTTCFVLCVVNRVTGISITWYILAYWSTDLWLFHITILDFAYVEDNSFLVFLCFYLGGSFMRNALVGSDYLNIRDRAVPWFFDRSFKLSSFIFWSLSICARRRIIAGSCCPRSSHSEFSTDSSFTNWHFIIWAYHFGIFNVMVSYGFKNSWTTEGFSVTWRLVTSITRYRVFELFQLIQIFGLVSIFVCIIIDSFFFFK